VTRDRALHLPLLPLLRELQGAVRLPLGVLLSRLGNTTSSASPHRTCLPALSPAALPFWMFSRIFSSCGLQNCT